MVRTYCFQSMEKLLHRWCYIVVTAILNYPTKCTRAQTEFWLLSSEDAGHRDWWNVGKNNLQNTAKEPEKPITIIRSRPWKPSRIQSFICSSTDLIVRQSRDRDWTRSKNNEEELHMFPFPIFQEEEVECWWHHKFQKRGFLHLS